MIGDILLLRSRGPRATVNRVAQLLGRQRNAHYTHVTLSLGDNTLVEAMLGAGVRGCHWHDVSDGYDLQASLLVRHGELHLDESALEKILERVTYFFGQPYRLWSAINPATGSELRNQAGLVCSQFVALVLQHAGHLDRGRHAMLYWPNDIDNATAQRPWIRYPLADVDFDIPAESSAAHTLVNLNNSSQCEAAGATIDRYVLAKSQSAEMPAGDPRADIPALKVLLDRWRALYLHDHSKIAFSLLAADGADRLHQHRTILDGVIASLQAEWKDHMQNVDAWTADLQSLNDWRSDPERLAAGAIDLDEELTVLIAQGKRLMAGERPEDVESRDDVWPPLEQALLGRVSQDSTDELTHAQGVLTRLRAIAMAQRDWSRRPKSFLQASHRGT